MCRQSSVLATAETGMRGRTAYLPIYATRVKVPRDHNVRIIRDVYVDSFPLLPFLSGENHGLGFTKSAAGEVSRAQLEHSSIVLISTALLILI
jgi:hypothetical protein